MRIHVHVACFTSLLLFSYKAFPQFNVAAELRPRTEFRNGFKRPLAPQESPAFFTEQRSRLYLAYKKDQFELLLAPQYIHMWGNNDQASKTDRGLANLQQAWMAYTFNAQHRIAGGRMELNYDNARILGNLDWAQQGRSHDVLKYEYAAQGLRIHGAVAFNQDTNVPEPGKLAETTYAPQLNNYKALQFLWFNKVVQKTSLSALLLNESRQYAADTVYYKQTGGIYGTFKLMPVILTAEYYHQRGRDRLGNGVRAHLASLNASTALGPAFRLELGGDYLTGDNSNTAANEAFDPLYGTHHQFYGLMDYFYVGNGHGNLGLNDLYTKAKYEEGHHRVQVDVHRFASTAALVDGANDFTRGSLFGWEFDVVYAYQLAAACRLQVGYSYMRCADALRAAKGIADGKNASWGWLMVAYKPILFEN
ncbi:hypothetical protein [Parapedobacter pyrenivorans]|uniref:hypothetical protein n=1 Tax=Parapedobacter pyrenivorans TaxID=1305674 RepID=UPI0033402117